MDRNRAKVLRKNVRYPAYQPSAWSDGSANTAESRLVLGALHVLEWVRTKFQEFEIPKAFMSALPEDYQQVRLDELESAHINEGYTVETICLPSRRIWAFRLVEPDLSVVWKDGEYVSTAVPGRIFETNVAFAAAGAQIQCGINVMVSEPEGTQFPGRVFCPAFVRHLAEDPRFGLTSGYPIQNRLFELRTRDRLKALRDYLDSGHLPAVVFCDAPASPEKEPKPLKMPVPRNSLAVSGPSSLLEIAPSVLAQVPRQRLAEWEETPELPPYVERFVKHRMGYVHSFHLTAPQMERFSQLFHISPEEGCAIFMEPKRYGGKIRVFPQSVDVFGKLMELSRDYPREKTVQYRQISFLNDAKLLQAADRKEMAGSAESVATAYEERLALLENAHADDLMKKNNRIEQQVRKINCLTERLDAADERLEVMREEFQRELELAKEREQTLQSRIRYLESLKDRPAAPKDVPKWAEKRFAGRLLLHSRAEKMLQTVSAKEVNIHLLCDSLEYLASEYRDQKAGFMSRSQADLLCAQKYNRPFDIAPCGATAVEMFPDDYRIKYDMGQKGQSKDAVLDWHLKIGKTTENLIRIYFLYDDRRKLVVVGSLPRHLRTAQVQA